MRIKSRLDTVAVRGSPPAAKLMLKVSVWAPVVKLGASEMLWYQMPVPAPLGQAEQSATICIWLYPASTIPAGM